MASSTETDSKPKEEVSAQEVEKKALAAKLEEDDEFEDFPAEGAYFVELEAFGERDST
jgi:hypothetical protein